MSPFSEIMVVRGDEGRELRSADLAHDDRIAAGTSAWIVDTEAFETDETRRSLAGGSAQTTTSSDGSS